MNKYEEALKRLKGMIYTSPFSDEKSEIDYNDLKKCDTQLQNNYLENINTLQELISNYEKYSWHDLRKNPEDLPPDTDTREEKPILVQFRSNYYGVCDNWDAELEYFGNYDVLRWRYIEPFESEEE